MNECCLKSVGALLAQSHYSMAQLHAEIVRLKLAVETARCNALHDALEIVYPLSKDKAVLHEVRHQSQKYALEIWRLIHKTYEGFPLAVEPIFDLDAIQREKDREIIQAARDLCDVFNKGINSESDPFITITAKSDEVLDMVITRMNALQNAVK